MNVQRYYNAVIENGILDPDRHCFKCNRALYDEKIMPGHIVPVVDAYVVYEGEMACGSDVYCLGCLPRELRTIAIRMEALRNTGAWRVLEELSK